MSGSMKATFGTRREAELVVEKLVQTLGLAREAILVAPDGEETPWATGCRAAIWKPQTPPRRRAPMRRWRDGSR